MRGQQHAQRLLAARSIAVGLALLASRQLLPERQQRLFRGVPDVTRLSPEAGCRM